MDLPPWLRRQCHTTAPRLRVISAITLSVCSLLIAFPGPLIAPHYYPNKDPTALTACLVAFAFATSGAGLLVAISHHVRTPLPGRLASRGLLVVCLLICARLLEYGLILPDMMGINMVRE
jgi:hypothetical protein